MHFYTYDQWYSNTYYSQDNTEIAKGNTRIIDLSTIDGRYLNIRSCWKNPRFVPTLPKYTNNPQFVRTLASSPIIYPKMSTIDCDIGCLYQLKYYDESTSSEYRSNRGCIQPLDKQFGSFSSLPYISIMAANGSPVVAKKEWDSI